RVVFEEVPHRLRITEVVDRDDLEAGIALEVSAEEVAADAAESVDPNTRLCHGASLVDRLSKRRGCAGFANSAVSIPKGFAGTCFANCGGPLRRRLRCRDEEARRLCRPAV